MKSKIKIVTIVLFLSVSILLVSFGGQKAEWKGTIEEVDGDKIVKNPREPMYSENVISLKEGLSIGDVEGKKEHIFSQRRNTAVYDEGNIYVLDRKEFHIKA